MTGSNVPIPSSYWGNSQYDIAVNKDTLAPQGQSFLYQFAVTLNKEDAELIDALQVESNTATAWEQVTKEVDGLTITFKVVGNIRFTEGYKISRSDGGEIKPGLTSQVFVGWKDAQDPGQPGGYGVWENGVKVFPL